MSRQTRSRSIERRSSRSQEALHTTNLVEELARVMLKDGGGSGLRHTAPSEVQVHGAVRLCVRILTSHIGEPLIAGDEASISQAIRTRLVKVPTADGSGVDSALRFEDLHRRLRLLGCVNNRAPMLNLLYALMGTDGRNTERGTGMAKMPPRIFSEPPVALSGIDRVGKVRVGPESSMIDAMDSEAQNGRGFDGQPPDHARTSQPSMITARATSEVAERTLLRGILYAFQGIDSQYIKFCDEQAGYVLDPRLRLRRSQRQMVTKMLEMGWLFTMIVRYIQLIEGKTDGRTQQAFVMSLKEDMTEYYRLIAVLGAQLNLDSEGLRNTRVGGGESEVATEGLTLKRLAVWVTDPLERLKHMATLVSAASRLKGGALATCLHTHMQHGNPFVRGLVHRTLVRACEPLFFMLKTWVFEGELVDKRHEFFVEERELAMEDDEKLWQERYSLDLTRVPKFIDAEVASKILTIGKSINFLRRLCGDSEWIMGPMANAAARAQTLEYGNTASLRAVVDSCSTLTNARLVDLIMGKYRLKDHLRVLKKLLLHGQGDLMLNLVEAVGPELEKSAVNLYLHNLNRIVDGVLKTSTVAQENPEDMARIRAKMLPPSESDTGWHVFSLSYDVTSPISTIVNAEAINDYRRVFHILWRIKRVEWTLAAAWRLQTSATHVRLERTLPELRSALHRCSLIRGQMFFLTTNLSNYMMFEVLETSWGSLQERLDTACTLDDLIDAHRNYLTDIMGKALLHPDSRDISYQLEEVLSIIIEFCSHQESLVIRAMAEVTTRRAEQEEKERRTALGKWGTEGQAASGTLRAGRQLLGMKDIEDTAKRYEDKLSDLVRLLEEKGGKTEILRFLTFRLDFNNYYKERRANLMLPPPVPRGRGLAHESAASTHRR